MKKKADEENFDEAVQQSYRAWTETKVPSEISDLFADPSLTSLSPSSSPFFHLLSALQEFVSHSPEKALPLSSTLPDMKSDTANYIHLQKLYKARAEEEKAQFAAILKNRGVQVDWTMIDEFVRNAHGLKIIRGKRWGSFLEDPATIGINSLICGSLCATNRVFLASALASSTKETATHLALCALSDFLSKNPEGIPTTERLTAYIANKLPPGTELPEEVEHAIGEVYASSNLFYIFYITDRSLQCPNAHR